MRWRWAPGSQGPGLQHATLTVKLEVSVFGGIQDDFRVTAVWAGTSDLAPDHLLL